MADPYWYPTYDRWHDQTGTSHLLTDSDPVRLRCGGRYRGLGGGTTDPENQHGTQRCRRCLAIQQTSKKA